jgi:hypothetical protein
MVDQLVDVPVSQQASPPRAEPSVHVEISSSSGTQSPPAQTEIPNSPEMNSPFQPDPPSPPRAQSPTGQAETSTPVEVNPTSLQPEASALPGTSPSPVIPEAAPEQNPAPVQEIRHEVLICV